MAKLTDTVHIRSITNLTSNVDLAKARPSIEKRRRPKSRINGGRLDDSSGISKYWYVPIRGVIGLANKV